MKKRFAAILLSVCMLLTMIPLSVFAESTIIDSGECGANGNNVIWELDSNNTLTISGSGAMADYTWTNFVPTTPWYQYRNSITRIVVKDGVTSIGSTAFYKLSYATSFEITNDVLAFGSYAFASCSNLHTVDFPDNLQYIANYCFEDCRNLTSVTIPETVTKLGDCVFTGCTNLKNVALPSNMTVLPRGFFSECTSLESIEIPNSVTEFVSYCFRDCIRLKRITFPAALTTIGYRVFSGCTGLEAVTLPNTVTTLGAETFYNCSGLVELELPQNLQTISSSLCYGCTKLQSIEIPASVTAIEDTAFSNCSSLSSVVLQEGLEKLGKSVFYKCTNLTNIVFPESITSIGTNAYGFYKNIYDETDVIPGAKLYCYARSMGETYAQNAGIPYSTIDIDIEASDCEYTGTPVTPSVTISIDGQLLQNGSNFTVLYENNTNIGTAIARIHFIGDYSSINGTIVKSFRIGKSINNCEIVLDKEKYQYHMYLPEATVRTGNDTLVINKDYEVYYTLAGEMWKKAGTTTRELWSLGECSIKIVGINDYIGEAVITVIIEKFDMANAKIVVNGNPFDLQNFEYDGTEKTQNNVVVRDEHHKTISREHYEISYKDNINVGTATMIITGKGDYYTGTLEKQFQIYPRAIRAVEVTKLPNKLAYNRCLEDRTIDPSGGEITIYYQNGGVDVFEITSDMLVNKSFNPLGATENVWVNVEGGSAYYQISIYTEHIYSQKTIAPTYTENGYTEYTCFCGDTYRTDYTNVLTMPAPKVSIATDSVSGKQIISWDEVDDSFVYEIYRSTSKTGKYSLISTVETTTWQDTSASVGKTYYYKVKAIHSENTSLNSEYSDIVSAATKCATPTLDVYAGSTGKPVLTWAEINGAVNYEIWRSVDGADFKKLATTKKLTYTDTKATAGTHCTYKVRALSSTSSCHSLFSEELGCNVICAAPVITSKIDTQTGKPVLSWKKVTGAIEYAIYRSMNGNEFQLLTTTTAVSYQDNSAALDNEYSYYVVSVGKTETLNSVPSTAISITVSVQAPKLSGSADANGKPVISWAAIENAVSYKVYRSTKTSSGYELLATVTDLSYNDTTVETGKTFYYKVVAVGTNTESVQSSYLKQVGKCATPTIQVAVDGASGKPIISWEQIDGAKKYTIYRATSENGKYSLLGTSAKLTYTDSKAAVGTKYFYKVVANPSTSTSNSNYSNIESCTVICAAPNVTVKINTTSGKPMLSWKKVTGATSYAIYRDGQLLTTTTTVSYQDNSASLDSEYSYCVVAIGKTETLNSVPSTAISITVSVQAPKLSGSADANGKPVISWAAIENAVSYKVYRSTKTSSGYELLATVTDLSYNDTTVETGKTFYYKVVAVGTNTESVQSSYLKQVGKCATPTIQVAVDGASGKPIISWEQIDGAKKYTIYRATSENGKYSQLGTSTKQNYIDTKATVGTKYFYKVVANPSTSTSNSNYSNIESCTVICAAPNVTVKISTTSGMPMISWKKVTGATSYAIYRDGQLLTTTTTVSYQDNSAALDNEYSYYVVSVGKTETLNSVPSTAISITVSVQAPKLSGSADANGKPVISWAAIENAVSYKVYRSTKTSSGYELLATVTDLSYNDTTVETGKTFYYKVVAVGTNTESVQSSYLKQVGKCATPTIQVAVDGASGKPIISWEQIDGAKKYTIYRATSENGKYSQLGTSTKLSYSDTKATVGTKYFYKVVANPSASTSNSNYSNIESCTVICAAPNVTVKVSTTSGKPMLSWSKVTGATSYAVYRNDQLLTTIAGIGYTDSSAQTGVTYSYKVITLGKMETLNSSESKEAFATATPAQPKLTGKVGTTGKPTLTWGEVEGATKYVIYRSTNSSKGYTVLEETENLTFTDTGATKGKTYYYKVVAICDDIQSAQSTYIAVRSK